MAPFSSTAPSLGLEHIYQLYCKKSSACLMLRLQKQERRPSRLLLDVLVYVPLDDGGLVHQRQALHQILQRLFLFGNFALEFFKTSRQHSNQKEQMLTTIAAAATATTHIHTKYTLNTKYIYCYNSSRCSINKNYSSTIWVTWGIHQGRAGFFAGGT